MLKNLDKETEAKLLQNVGVYKETFDELMGSFFGEMRNEFEEILLKKFLCVEVAGYAASRMLGYLLVNCESEQAKLKIIDMLLKQSKEHEAIFEEAHKQGGKDASTIN